MSSSFVQPYFLECGYQSGIWVHVMNAKTAMDANVVLAGGLTVSIQTLGGRLAISTSTALAAPGAGSPNCHTLQLLLRL
jgi:hypothetical protein